MQINESTYETIFLLYIDNELSAKERLEVEDFIAAHPNYAAWMEALKATVVQKEAIPYSLKAQLKKVPVDALDEMNDIDTEWNQAYKNYLAEDMQAIQGLSNHFKASLKKNNESKGKLMYALGFHQNKFTYAAVAALLMVFLGYQQLTETTVVKSATATVTNATKPRASTNKFEIAATANQPLQSKAQVTKTSETQIAIAPQMDLIANESIVLNASTNEQKQLNSTNIVADIPQSSGLNSTATNTSASINTDTEITTEEKATIMYEVIDTDDPNRTIYIANFEIDGNKLRGLKRKVNSLFKNNKSDRNK